MPDNTLLGRCVQAWADEHALVPMTVERRQLCARGTRAVIEHLAAELVVAGHQDAAGWLLGQLTAEVISLRPRTEEPA
jgi:hypothetical protein